MFSGIIASSGIAIGKAVVLKKVDTQISNNTIQPSDIEFEIKRYQSAIKQTVEQLQSIRERTLLKLGETAAAVFDGHILIASDEELEVEVINLIKQLLPADTAVNKAINNNIALLSNLDDPYLRERATDIKDIGNRVIHNLNDIEMIDLGYIDTISILIADDLTPSETSQINLDYVQGFITDAGGNTSHSAIMARSLELPAIVGAKIATQNIKNNDHIILDAINNKILINPEIETILAYKKTLEKLKKEHDKLTLLKNSACTTSDGHQFKLYANIGTINDLPNLKKHGAEGIGLYRTEFLFMDRKQMPSEEEQFLAYKSVVTAMQNKTVIIRTMDIGGDKHLPYIDTAQELNPFLGWRAIRICFDQPEILNTQLRAIIRASAFGSVKILFPMVISVEEAKRLKQWVNTIKHDLKQQSIAFNEQIEIGIMIETPAAVMIADWLIQEVDFFSIGSNDLTQYMLAIDRGNEKIASLYDPLSPSVLRAIKRVVDIAHAANKWVGVCGEMASNPQAALLLAGMGLNELSMTASSIPKIKQLLHQYSLQTLKNLVERVMDKKTIQEVYCIFEQYIKP